MRSSARWPPSSKQGIKQGEDRRRHRTLSLQLASRPPLPVAARHIVCSHSHSHTSTVADDAYLNRAALVIFFSSSRALLLWDKL